MTDQIPADLTPEEVEAAREWATSYLRGFYKPCHVDAAARALTALLPAPVLPTLADMTDEERHACQWMQADVTNRSVRYVIANPLDDENEAALIDPDGDICWLLPGRITPRPDLPRMTWPGTGQKAVPAPALPDGWRLADHKVYGRVIVTTPVPDDDGDVWFIRRDDCSRRQYDIDWCKPDELTYIDPEADQ